MPFSNWRSDFGDDRAEISALETLLLAHLRRMLPKHAFAHAETFVQYRFSRRLRNFGTFAVPYAYAFTFFRLSSIAAGAGVSAIAAFALEPGWGRWLIILIGVMTAVTATINEAWRPGAKALSRFDGKNALLDEAHAFLGSTGRYRTIDTPYSAWLVFQTEVARIGQEADEADRDSFRALSDSGKQSRRGVRRPQDRPGHIQPEHETLSDDHGQ